MATIDKRVTQGKRLDRELVRAVIEHVAAKRAKLLERLAPHDGPVEKTKNAPKQ